MSEVEELQPAGRPRRFDAETEVQMIVDATKLLLQRNDYEDVSVGAILTEAGLSTRSFYRHWSSKDELLIALYTENAERAAERLAKRVATAPTPRDGLANWVDELLSFAFDPRKARRVAIFDAPSARRAAGYGDADLAARKLLMGPLLDVLERGLQDGSFPHAVPKRDARSIYALVWDVNRWSADIDRSEALAHVMRFVLPGLTAVPLDLPATPA